MSKLFLPLLAASSMLLTACPGTFQQQKMQNDVDGMKREIQQLQASQGKGAGDAQLRQRLAEMGAQLDQLRTDISLVQGRLESMQNDLAKRGDDQSKVRQDLEIRIAQLDDQVRQIQARLGVAVTSSGTTPAPTPMVATASPAPSPMGTLAVPPGSVMPTPHPTTPGQTFAVASPEPTKALASTAGAKETDQSLYQKGVEAFDAKHYPDARSIFGQVITKFPKSEFADNARYWIGESYYAEKDYASAALEFEKVVKDYPNGDKVPAALLKQGYAFLELGEKEGGTETLRELIKRYPKSEEAKKAKEKLAKVK
jgi:tol-pal system protein YbgF